jgi:hypothetical protein
VGHRAPRRSARGRMISCPPAESVQFLPLWPAVFTSNNTRSCPNVRSDGLPTAAGETGTQAMEEEPCPPRTSNRLSLCSRASKRVIPHRLLISTLISTSNITSPSRTAWPDSAPCCRQPNPSGHLAGAHVAFYDLLRVHGAKIAEHWDVIEKIPPESEWKNRNGKFQLTPP